MLDMFDLIISEYILVHWLLQVMFHKNCTWHLQKLLDSLMKESVLSEASYLESITINLLLKIQKPIRVNGSS